MSSPLRRGIATLGKHSLLSVIAVSVLISACAQPPSLPATAASPAASPAPVAGPAASVVARHVLPDLAIATAQNAVLPGSVQNDRKILLGGVGSDLWRARNDPPNEFWMTTDRGPNGQISVEGANRRTFPISEFTPLILRARMEGASMELLQTIPIVGQSGRPVTGLSNIDGVDEVPWDVSAQTRLTYNPNGLDTEGLVRTSNGEFWLVDEYSPSLLRVDAGGKVVKRYIPQGLNLTGTDYPVSASLPAKIEGVAMLDRGLLAVVNDNDFDFTGFDPSGNATLGGVKSQVLYVKLTNRLP
jgi:hypothetical protein